MTGAVMLLGSGCSLLPMRATRGGVKALSLCSSSSIIVSIIALLHMHCYLANDLGDVIFTAKHDKLGQKSHLTGSQAHKLSVCTGKMQS